MNLILAMKTWVIVTLSALAVILAGGLLFYWFVYNKPHTDYDRAVPDFEITAKELYSVFITDEQIAAQQYTGKVLEVSGQVHAVEQVQELVIVSFAFEEGMFGAEGVRCTMLEGYHQQALQISPGQQVVLKGYCTGFTGNDVIMEHCSFP